MLDIEKIAAEAEALRQRLHQIPERSMEERETRRLLREYLGTAQTPDLPYILVKLPGNGEKPARTAFRADFDAVCLADGIPGHYCGHDGHTAILAAVCNALRSVPHENDLYFIFQPGEETGEGGAICAPVLERENINEIYALHNIPGKPFGNVLLREGTFACASTGLELCFTGAPAHAAYPESGANPTAAMAELVLFAREYISQPHAGVLLSTVIGMEAGGDSYGMSAANGTLRLTLRAERQQAFEALLAAVKGEAERLAALYGLKLSVREIERFPATENTPACTQKLARLCAGNGIPVLTLPEPMRWSEDFGHYLLKMPGAYFGIGAGEDYPDLHTVGFSFPVDIMPTAIKLLLELAAGEQH